MRTRHLSPYKIAWAIIQKTDNSCEWKLAATKELLLKDTKFPLNCKVYIINDKQFSMMKGTFNGVAAKCPNPFTHFIVADNKTRLWTIPMTKKQFENPLVF